MAYSGFADEFQPAGGLKRMRVKGADFGHAADIERYHQAVAGDAGCDDAGAFRQRRRDVGGDNASLGAEKTIADGDQNGRNRQRRGKAGNQHHPPHPREQRGLLGGGFGRNGLGHKAHLETSFEQQSKA
jgi:hypothetical protein